MQVLRRLGGGAKPTKHPRKLRLCCSATLTDVIPSQGGGSVTVVTSLYASDHLPDRVLS